MFWQNADTHVTSELSPQNAEVAQDPKWDFQVVRVGFVRIHDSLVEHHLETLDDPCWPRATILNPL